MKISSLACFVFALVAGTASAQSVANATFDEYVGDVILLQSKPIQKELGVTEAQRARMNAAADRYRTTLTALDKGLNGRKPTETDFKKAQPQIQAAGTQLKLDILAVLTTPQKVRLRELTLQRSGLSAINDPRVAEKIGLSGASLTKFRSTYREGGLAIAAIQRKATEPIMAKYKGKQPKTAEEGKALQQQVDAELRKAAEKVSPQIRALEASISTKLLALLTPKQKAAYENLRGKTFRPK